MDGSSVLRTAPVAPEVHFANILEEFRTQNGQADVFSLLQRFTAVAAERALAIGPTADSSSTSKSVGTEFSNWDSEAKLWHLLHVLYLFRLSETAESPKPESQFMTVSAKRERFLEENPKIRELALIVLWLQYNTPDVEAQPASDVLKWNNTRVAIDNKSILELAPSHRLIDYVSELDSDAPLRSSKAIAPEDKSADEANFAVIYQLVLQGEVQRAIEFSNDTGNYTTALILVGYAQEFVDPLFDDDIMEDDTREPSGQRHSSLWYQAIRKLVREPGLGRYESLIYSYLSGANLSENIKEAAPDWEKALLLYANQLCVQHMVSILDEVAVPPTPSYESIEAILNTLLKTPAFSEESKSPFRVMMGSVMIDKLNLFLYNTANEGRKALLEDRHILRVLAHMSLFVLLIGAHDGSKTPTKIITRYISKLAELGMEDIVPVYLTFIPDEKDVRECYSIFLSSITDPEKRAKQIDIFKRLDVVVPDVEETSNEDASAFESKIQNVLKRTVQRVMEETKDFYTPQGLIEVEDEEIDPIDMRLWRSVEWFYENRMFEDSITATITVLRRFLLTGRLASIKEFTRDKNFKLLIKDYDFDVQTKSLSGGLPTPQISDEDKEELLQYEQMGECLRLLGEWKSFSTGWGLTSETFWKSDSIANLINKTQQKLRELVFLWFVRQIENTADIKRKDMYEELRSIYIPYFIIELLQVLQQSRLHDWEYMRKAFALVQEVADDKSHDLMKCFISCGRLGEFMALVGKIAFVASEEGVHGIFV